jgi:hypothetical protein
VTRSRSPFDAALDLLVFAPLGLAVTAAEEIPRLAARGRAELTGQFGIARLIGQLAVGQGHQHPSRTMAPEPDRPDHPPTWASRPAATRPDRVPDAPDAGVAAGPDLSGPDGRGVGRSPGPPPGEGIEPPEVAGTADVTDTASTTRAESTAEDQVADPENATLPTPDGLAIPGYDSLAASQVVPRLAGLSAPELAAVGRYEAAHRGRRTILTRVRQLQGR